MQLCDPPIRMASLEASSGPLFNEFYDECIMLSEKDGIKMGMIFDAAAVDQWKTFGGEYDSRTWYFILRFGT